MALVSPGVEVSVTDESRVAETTATTVPLLVVATAENKETPSGTIAEGTLAENAGDLYVLNGQRDLLTFFGSPAFYTDTSNTPIHGYELNEYGLQTAYSLLGTTSRCYVLRADVDLAELASLSGRPQSPASNGTLWLDLVSTRWGIFEWSQTEQEFGVKTPDVITDSSDLTGGVPKSSIGSVGSYAIVGTNASLPAYYKNRDNNWVLIGSRDWMNSVPAVISGFVSPTVTASESIDINGTIVTITGSTISTVADDINNAGIDGISAEVNSSRLEIFVDDRASSDGSTADGAMIIANDSGNVLEDLGIDAGTYYRPAVQQSAHTLVPQWKTTDNFPRPAGSVWVKTTGANFGADFAVNRYNAATNNWQLVSAPLFENDSSANAFYDALRGGIGIAAGTIFVQYDVQEADTVTYKIFERSVSGETIVTGTDSSPTFTSGDSFNIRYSVPNSTTLTSTTTITLNGTTAESFVQDVLGENLQYISARVNSNGSVSISHTAGGVFEIEDASGTPLADAGIDSSVEYARSGPDGELIVSNWTQAEVEISSTQPGNDPVTGTKWYWGQVGDVDIMIHDGTDWKGYRNVTSDTRGFNLSNTDADGPIVSATEPTVQSDGSSLEYGDLWVDSSDLENFPLIRRYSLVNGDDVWVEIDNSDQTTENGILFADARFAGDSTTSVSTGEIEPISDLLNNDYLDPDAPDPALYPRGMLLLNTRRSSFNVKEYRRNYFNQTDFPGIVLPTEKDAWVTVSGSRTNGHAYFGRKAQRNVVAAAMAAAIDSNTEIREEQRLFNLLAAPGYPELIQNLIQLNNDRKQTAFVVGDSPLRIASEGNQLTDWLLNTDLNPVDNEESLVTTDEYLGVWYPAVLGNDLNGNQIVMPSSYSVLRMMVRNDQVAYPWFAPAGTRRGVIDNASRLGYLNNEGEFVSIRVREGVRDTLYENNVNPLMQTAQTGIIAYGQKTRASTATALDRINVARLVAFMRLQLDNLVRPFLFEPNDKITRDELKGVVESFCNDLVSKRGLTDYAVICDESNNTPERIDRNELYVDVAIEPSKSVEFVYIPVRIRNTGEIGG